MLHESISWLLYNCIKIKSVYPDQVIDICLIYYAHTFHPRRVRWKSENIQKLRMYYYDILRQPNLEFPYRLKNTNVYVNQLLHDILARCIAIKTRQCECIGSLTKIYWKVFIDCNKLTTANILDLCIYYALKESQTHNIEHGLC